VAEPEQADNNKAFAIDSVVGDCPAANHWHANTNSGWKNLSFQ